MITLQEWLEKYQDIVYTITGYGCTYNDFTKGELNFPLHQYDMERFLKGPHRHFDIAGVCDNERVGEWVYEHEWLKKTEQEQKLCQLFGYWIPERWEYSMLVYTLHQFKPGYVCFDPEEISQFLREMK